MPTLLLRLLKRLRLGLVALRSGVPPLLRQTLQGNTTYLFILHLTVPHLPRLWNLKGGKLATCLLKLFSRSTAHAFGSQGTANWGLCPVYLQMSNYGRRDWDY